MIVLALCRWSGAVFRPFAALALAFLLAAAPALAATASPAPVPALAARVTDLTSTLSAEQKQMLDSAAQGLEKRGGVQLAILLLPSTQPESIEQYSIRVAEAWKLGQKAKSATDERADRGVLLLVAKNDRKVRIEVGYGLEGAIPDALARRIIDEAIAPRFKRSDFAGGLKEGIDRLAAVVDGQAAPDTAPPARTAAPADFVDRLFDVPPWLLFGFIILGPAFRWLLGSLVGSLAFGSLIGGSAWLAMGAAGPALFLGVAAFLFVLASGSRRVASRGRNALGGTFGGSAGRWGGGSGGGGFSGGGGSFGGGGASGSW